MSRHQIAAVLSLLAEEYREGLADEILADPLHFADEIIRGVSMKPTVHDDFERTAEDLWEEAQAPNIRAANEWLHRRIAELEAERDALADELYVLKSRVQNLMAEAV